MSTALGTHYRHVARLGNQPPDNSLRKRVLQRDSPLGQSAARLISASWEKWVKVRTNGTPNTRAPIVRCWTENQWIRVVGFLVHMKLQPGDLFVFTWCVEDSLGADSFQIALHHPKTLSLKPTLSESLERSKTMAYPSHRDARVTDDSERQVKVLSTNGGRSRKYLRRHRTPKHEMVEDHGYEGSFCYQWRQHLSPAIRTSWTMKGRTKKRPYYNGWTSRNLWAVVSVRWQSQYVVNTVHSTSEHRCHESWVGESPISCLFVEHFWQLPRNVCYRLNFKKEMDWIQMAIRPFYHSRTICHYASNARP